MATNNALGVSLQLYSPFEREGFFIPASPKVVLNVYLTSEVRWVTKPFILAYRLLGLSGESTFMLCPRR
jgi:hypothetical protein